MSNLLQNFNKVFSVIVLCVCVRNTLQLVLTLSFPGFVKGIQDAGIPSLDPIQVNKKININLLDNVKMTFYNGELSGLGTCITDEALSYPKNRTYILNIHCNLIIKGQYKIVGKVLHTNLETNGDAKLKIPNQKIRVEALFGKLKRNDKGEGHYEIKSYTYKADYGTDVDLNLTNLYSDNSTISANILESLSTTSQLAGEIFRGPILDYAIDKAMNAMQKFFNIYKPDQISKDPLTD